ncbi:unnamed protein product [Urochloa humidicola]
MIPSGKQEDIPVLLKVEAPNATEHVPVDLVVLIDVSASMNIEVAPGTTKLDLVKKVMKFVIEHLHEDDGLAFMPFNNETILTDYSADLFRISSQRVVAQNMVDNLVAKGDTAFIMPVLNLAEKVLSDRSDNNRVGVIMLLTDGLDSSKAPAMCPILPKRLQKYPIHTFGIGAHDPNVLLSIAQQSCGTYSFVDGSELGRVTDPFAVLLGGLHSIVASDVVVRLKWNCNWTSVKWIGCGFNSSVIDDSDNGRGNAEIRVGMLYAGEVKNYIVQLNPDTSISSVDWAQASICFSHAPWCTSELLKTRKLAGDDAGENSPMVRGQIVQFRAVRFLSSLQTEFSKEKYTAGANGDKEASDAEARAAGSTLETRWAEFMKEMGDNLLNDLNLDDLQMEVQEMASRLKRGAGMGYMCSWLSSQQMQTATTWGSASAVGGTRFLTQEMEKMLSESKKHHVQLPHGVKLQKTKAAWDELKRQAQDMLNQPANTALSHVWMELETAIEKAKDKDVEEAIKRGEI